MDIKLQHSKSVIDSCHYEGDKLLHKELLADKKIKDASKDLIGKFKTNSNHRIYELLGHSLQISKKSAPNIFVMFEDCQKILNLEKFPLNAFINSSQDLNAYCSFNENEITIELNSGIIKACSDAELMFIIGHEFGHALFNHHSLPAYGIYQSVNLVPSKVLKLMSWSRQAEISADRAGLLCCQDINAASRALIKLSCGGLDENYISFDYSDFQKQVLNRKGVDKTDEIYFTHPLSPLRVSAIMDFWNSEALASINGVPKKDLINNKTVDKNILEILSKMNPEPKTKKELKNKDNFVLFAAYYVLIQDNISSSDQTISVNNSDKAYRAELESLSDICGSLEVEDFITNIADKMSLDQFTDEINKAAGQFKKSKKGIKCAAIEKIITVARADGELSTKEMTALYKVTSLIGINKDFVDQILKFLD